jgi:hypothetical protein
MCTPVLVRANRTRFILTTTITGTSMVMTIHTSTGMTIHTSTGMTIHTSMDMPTKRMTAGTPTLRRMAR